MKQKLLLFLTAFLISHSVFSQTYANTPPNIFQCNNEVFDLTLQIPIILGSQDPTEFSVAFFLTLPDAVANVNEITNTFFFTGMQQQIIFARVTSNSDQTFATTSFQITWSSSWIPELNDVTVCDVYFLPQLESGEYFTGPNRTGTELFPNDAITSSTMLYIHSSNESCTEETSFTITVNPSPNITEMENVYSCTPYTLPMLIEGDYYTEPDQTGVMLDAGTIISQTTTLYIAAGFGFCTAEQPFFVSIGNPVVSTPSQLVVCSDLNFAEFNLQSKVPELTVNAPTSLVTFHQSLTDAMTGANPVNADSYFNFVPLLQTIYVRVENPNGGCFSTTTLELVIVPCTQNTITGTIRLDSNNTGCDSTDPAAANLQVSNTNNGVTTFAFTDTMGNYTFTNAQVGTNVITIQSGLPASFGIATPSSHNVVISAGSADEFGVNNFCLSAAPYNDASVFLGSSAVARPGFPITYYMTVSNVGTTVLNGSATFTYDAAKLIFVQTLPVFGSQTANSFTFNFTDLQPLQQKIFAISFTVGLPNVVSLGDIITLSAAVNVAADENLNNNTTTWIQTVVNSYDPNDISVKEGATISEAQADDYLHYTIRFQNTGNADAINVRLTNDLDVNLDWSTFRPIVASHAYQTELVDGKVVFRFNNINLASILENEPASHGYVMYKIKPIAALAVGDVISNQANIFFDFNAPITTNIVTTQIVVLGTSDVALDNLKLYPNPASEVVNLEFDAVSALDVSVFDIQGKLILRHNATTSPSKLDVSGLESGLYFVKMTNGAQSVTKKLIVK